MTPKNRIKQYQRALNYYKKYPSGRGFLNVINENGHYFMGICDIVYRDKDGEPLKGLDEFKLPELDAVNPNRAGLFWWVQTTSGVKTRIKKLESMIEMAKEATD